jgi:hypothetical protein
MTTNTIEAPAGRGPGADLDLDEVRLRVETKGEYVEEWLESRRGCHGAPIKLQDLAAQGQHVAAKFVLAEDGNLEPRNPGDIPGEKPFYPFGR